MSLPKLRTVRKDGEAALVDIMHEMGWETKEARRAIRCTLSAIRVWMLAMGSGIDICTGAQLSLRGMGALSWKTSVKTGATQWIWASHGKIRRIERAASRQSLKIMKESRKKVLDKLPKLAKRRNYYKLLFEEYQTAIYEISHGDGDRD